MTNQDALIQALKDEFDDDGAGRECWIHYHISCPYRAWDERALCHNNNIITRGICYACKEKWLASEVEE